MPTDKHRIIGVFDCKSNTTQSQAKTCVTLAARDPYDAVLVRRGRGHNFPIEPTVPSAGRAGLDVALPCGVIFLKV